MSLAAALCLVLLGPPEPILVGGCAHGPGNIRALAELGMGNLVWIPADVYATTNVAWDAEHTLLDDVDACVASGLHFLTSVRRGLGDTTRPGGYDYGGHADEFLTREEVAEVARRGGALFAGLHGEELDADFVQEAIRPSFRARTPELYRFHDRPGGRAAFEGELSRLRERYHEWGARWYPNLCVTYHHSGFRTGGDVVVAELLEHLPTTELQLAYLRGGARQFGLPWGAWVSPWWIGRVPTEDKDLWPQEFASLDGGHDPSALRRCLWLSWASGARTLFCQETAPLLSGGGEGGYRAGPWGRELQAFWQSVRDAPAPVEPLVALALLVDRDNGWAPAHLWIDWNLTDSVWGKLPLERGDRMLTNWLGLLLPGYGRTSDSVRARTDAFPGYFADTPLGPFDIVSSDVGPDALRAYRAIALVGDVAMTPELRATLRDYAAGGGIVLLNALHMRQSEAWIQDEPLLGARIADGPWSRIRAASRIVAVSEVEGIPPGEFVEPWFASVEVAPSGAEVVATDGEGAPVLLRHAVGAGKVYLSTPEYCLEGWGDQSAPLGYFRTLLGQLGARGGLSAACAEGGVSWLPARRGAQQLLLLANHAPSERTATLSAPAEGAWQVLVGTGELGRQAERDSVAVGPEDVALLQWNRTAP